MSGIYLAFESVAQGVLAGVQSLVASTYGQIIIFILAIYLITVLVKIIKSAVSK